MLISGAWAVDDDGIARPYLHGEIQRADGQWEEIAFLVDTGADRTVLSSQSFEDLGFTLPETVGALQGLGGLGAAVDVQSSIRLFREDGSAVTFNGTFAAMVTPTGLDTCVIGRDLLNLFAVIIDRVANTVLLVRPPHRYSILTG